MQYKLRLTLILLLFLCEIVGVHAQINTLSYHSGMTFMAHTKNQDERTGLSLTPTKSMTFNRNGFSLEFDLKLRNELHTYGYVCRIISGKTLSFDIISHLLESKLSFLLTDVDKVTANTTIQDSTEIVGDKWLKVKLLFNMKNIIVHVNDKEQVINQSFQKFDDIRIYFGTNKDVYFYTTDVPPMTVRNIVIRDDKNKIVNKWELSTHNKNEVYDEITKETAVADNPIWEIDRHTKWNKIASLILKTDGTNVNPLPQMAYDTITGRIFIVTRNRIYTYHIDTNKTDTLIPRNGFPYFRVGSSSQLIFDNKHNKLISYNPDLPKLNFYDFDKNEWSVQSIIEVDTRQHHNRFIDYKNNRLVVFGGYGIHRYSAQLSEIFISDTAKWSNKSLNSSIHPRYLSALCNLDDENILILGGYGSASGKQEESPKNYYDLYRVNVDTQKSTHLWSFVNDKDHYTFSNSMVADITANKIYALAYNNDRFYSSLYLAAFDIETKAPSVQILSDSIKYNFIDIKSYCDLFLYKKTSSLYALVQQELVAGESTVIDIYSLAFPPLSKDLIYIAESAKKEESLQFLLPLSITLFFIIACIISLFFYRRRRSETALDISPVERLSDPIDDDPKIEKLGSAICLLGGFRIYNKEGNNITGEFSPTIKQLMVYLLLNSVKNDKGTTSQRLDETFWFGMDKENASNNRRVNIRKLRLLLLNVGDIEIVNKNSYWYLNLPPDVYCDYREVSLLLHHLVSSGYADEKIIYQIVKIASVGSLLPNIDGEWIDEYKAEFSSKLIDALLEVLNKPLVSRAPKLLLKIADVILIHDNLDEDAIRIKCKVLFSMKQKGLSKQSYDKFCEDYLRLLNTTPDFTYEDIIHDLTID